MTTTPGNTQRGLLASTNGMRSRPRVGGTPPAPPVTPTNPGTPKYGWQFEYGATCPNPMPNNVSLESFDLTRYGTVPTTESGVTNMGRAGVFETVSDYYLRNEDIMGGTPRDNTWSCVVWVKWRADYLDNRAVRSGGNSNFHFDLKWISGTPDKIQLRTQGTNPGYIERTIEHELTLSNTQYYMVDFFHDHTNDLVGLGVNAGTQQTQAHPDAFPQLIGPGPFEIGRVGKTDIAAVYWWQDKRLSEAERLFLYDNGNGYQF